jgi:hypothetical protein
LWKDVNGAYDGFFKKYEPPIESKFDRISDIVEYFGY